MPSVHCVIQTCSKGVRSDSKCSNDCVCVRDLPGGFHGSCVNLFTPQVVQSIEDHHLEVIALRRDSGFHGLVAYDSDYALCDIPLYFSAHALKLSRNGKSLTTNQYLMHEVAQKLNLHPNRFVILASLLGRCDCALSGSDGSRWPTLTN